MTREIRFYKQDREEFPFLSNFFPAKMKMDMFTWPTAEHYYQACKIEEWYGQDHQALQNILNATSPGAAKKLGSKVRLRPDWEEKREFYMMKALRAKFGQNGDLAQLLLETKSAVLIEDSRSDYYWGEGTDGSGKNRLGELLMQVRKEIKNRKPHIGYGTIKCLRCNDVIQSTRTHDFRYCFCGAVAVDGGKEYLKISGDQSDFHILVHAGR